MDISYDDERWAQMANSIPPDMPSDDLYVEIEKQYEMNRAQLAQNQKSIPSKLSKSMDNINESMHASSVTVHNSGNQSKELVNSLYRNRLIGLKILGQEIKIATTLTYQNLLKPVRSLMKQFHQADIRSYKKDISNLTKKYEIKKERIDIKARKRLRRINLFNMRRGSYTYSEKTLPYTEREQWTMDKYNLRLKNLNNLLQDSERRLAKVISAEERSKDTLDKARETLVALKGGQQLYTAAPAPSEVTKKEVYVSQPSFSTHEIQKTSTPVDKEFNKTQMKKMKEMEQDVPESVIKDLKKQFLTNGQYHASLLVAQKFPEMHIEKEPFLKEMDPPKIVMAAYIMEKAQMGLSTLKELNNLSTVQLMDIGNKIDKDMDVDKAWQYVKHIISHNTTPEQKEMSQEDPLKEKVVDITYSDDLTVAEVTKEIGNTTSTPEIHSNADEERTSARDTSIFDRSFEDNMRIAANAALLMQATKAYELIKNSIKEDHAVDFEINGDAYRAQKDHSGNFTFTKYDYNTGSYAPVTKDTAISLISNNSKDFLAFVNSDQNKALSAPEMSR